MDKKQYNSVIAHTLKQEDVASKSSLDTARAVFNNMGVALPTGTMKDVYDTIRTNDYMGWRSCTQEEAQEAANNGTAAMGISENCVVVLSAEDKDEPVARTNTVMTLSEDTRSLSGANLQYYMYTAMATGNSSPIVRIYQTDSRVVFSNSGKTWYIINRDMIYGDPSAFDDFYETRSCYNTYVRYNPDDIVSSDWTVKQYTNDELKLLFVIDPYGVAHYVKKRAASLDNLEAGVGYKDTVFRILYGRSPKYYARNLQGTWYETSSRDLTTVISESETLFGMHQVYDLVTWINIAQAVLKVCSIVCSFTPAASLPSTSAINCVTGIASNVLSMGEAIATNQLPAYVTTQIVNQLFDISWATKLLTLYYTVQGFAADAPNVSDFCRDKLNYCANKTNYTVYVQLKNNQFYRATDLYNAVRN